MTERTQWDESVDQAIELLIDDDTEAFVLTALKSDQGMRILQEEGEESDMLLLAIFTLIEEIRQRSVEVGTPLSPEQIMYSAGAVAEEHGYLEGEFLREDSDE